MEIRPFVDHPSHVYSLKDRPPLLLAEMLSGYGVIVGETTDAKHRPLFVPDSIKPLFEATLQHPTVGFLRAAYNLHAEKPEDLSPEDERLFVAIRQRELADNRSLVGRHYENHWSPDVRRQARRSIDIARALNHRVEGKHLLLRQVRSRITKAMEETRAVLIEKQQIFFNGELAS